MFFGGAVTTREMAVAVRAKPPNEFGRPWVTSPNRGLLPFVATFTNSETQGKTVKYTEDEMGL
jgi:hypothetical protein